MILGGSSLSLDVTDVTFGPHLHDWMMKMESEDNSGERSHAVTFRRNLVIE